MKKIFAFAMAALMVLGLVSCGNENEPEQKTTNEVAIAAKLCGTTQEQSTAILSKEGYVLAMAYEGMRMYIPSDKQSVFQEYAVAAASGKITEDQTIGYLKQIGRTYTIMEDEDDKEVLYAQYGTAAEAQKAETTWGEYVSANNLTKSYEYQTEPIDDTTVLFGFVLYY